MKKFLFSCLLFLGGPLFAYPDVSSDLKREVERIYLFPEGKKLLEKAEKEGRIMIYSAPFHSSSNAMWKSDERAIVLNSYKQRSSGEKMRSIIFELHNALSTHEFNHLDALAESGKISKWQYVEEVERVEHRNALQTKKMVEKGIAKRVLPPDCQWEIPNDFHTHYWYQLQCGHSDAIAHIYDFLSAHHDYAYLPSKTR